MGQTRYPAPLPPHPKCEEARRRERDNFFTVWDLADFLLVRLVFIVFANKKSSLVYFFLPQELFVCGRGREVEAVRAEDQGGNYLQRGGSEEGVRRMEKR